MLHGQELTVTLSNATLTWLGKDKWPSVTLSLVLKENVLAKIQF